MLDTLVIAHPMNLSTAVSLRTILVTLLLASSMARAQGAARTAADVSDLPLVEVRATGHTGTLAIFLSGDGGWADIDKQIGQTLAQRGVDVIGFDLRSYLRSGKRDADGTGADVQRVITHYLPLWGDTRIIVAGYSRGADFAPFVATRLSPELRSRLSLIAMFGLQEHASFRYRFSDLWATTTNRKDTPILPELERLRGTNMLCVYGTQEDESLCRNIDATLVYPVAKVGGHHFDGDYRALTDLILARMALAK
jgi:type IV secretory pathway VirJ component